MYGEGRRVKDLGLRKIRLMVSRVDVESKE
jgi:hypothetical protein